MCNVFLLQKVICEFLLLVFVYFGFTHFYYGNFQNTQKEKSLKTHYFANLGLSPLEFFKANSGHQDISPIIYHL